MWFPASGLERGTSLLPGRGGILGSCSSFPPSRHQCPSSLSCLLQYHPGGGGGCLVTERWGWKSRLPSWTLWWWYEWRTGLSVQNSTVSIWKLPVLLGCTLFGPLVIFFFFFPAPLGIWSSWLLCTQSRMTENSGTLLGCCPWGPEVSSQSAFFSASRYS